MVASIIMGLIALGSTITTGVVKSRQTKRAQGEARSLYNQQRTLQNRQNNFENKMATQNLDMQEDQLSFNEKMNEEQMKDTEAQTAYDIGKANTQFQKKAVDKMFPSAEESYLFKSRISGRYK